MDKGDKGVEYIFKHNGEFYRVISHELEIKLGMKKEEVVVEKFEY